MKRQPGSNAAADAGDHDADGSAASERGGEHAGGQLVTCLVAGERDAALRLVFRGPRRIEFLRGLAL